MSKLLQRLRILRTPIFVFTKFDVAIYVMSEGTAQGIPRPLQVIRTTFGWELDSGENPYIPAELRIGDEISSIVRNGYTHTLPNGTKVLYAPHTIYKVTYEVSNE